MMIRNTRRVWTEPSRTPRRPFPAWDLPPVGDRPRSATRTPDPLAPVVWSIAFLVGVATAYPVLVYGLPALISAVIHVGDFFGITARS